MQFIDYHFTILEDGSLVMNSELTSEDLNIKEGDSFKVKISEGIITFVKQPPQQIWEGY
jgi:formylmethanofuran dehydrogenase subunit D